MLKKLWKESASLIICGRNANNQHANGANYRILFMKRSSSASFMPNFVVFPGGTVEEADSRPDWMSCFRTLGVSEQQFKWLRTSQQKRPFIFDHLHPIHQTAQSNSAENTWSIDRNISLRLSAIRETFEEVGILIGKSASQAAQVEPDRLCKTFELTDAKRWQNDVHVNADKFMELCSEQSIIPDLWKLYEWSDWLTPTLFGKKRFDTAFYLTTLENQPEVLAEKNEVQEYMWASPNELLQMYEKGQIELAPPQYYEMCRLTHIVDIEDLQRFSRDRQTLGSTLFYPLYFAANDGMIFVYPGDGLYPDDPDYAGDGHDSQQFSDQSLAELRSRFTQMHRMEHLPGTRNGMCSISTEQPYNGHLSPLPRCGKHQL